MRSFNYKSQRVRFVVSVVRIVEQRVEWFLFFFMEGASLWKFPYYLINNSNIRVHKKYNKTFDRFLAHSALHEEITWPVWASEQSMWCKSEVSQSSSYSTCFILVREILPLLKIQYNDWDINRDKTPSAFSTWLIAKKMTRLCTKDHEASKPDRST